ncbi:ankyrin repeat domain-containing protein, partial [Acinetobacter baumannii]|uniref:ankyrin repeat domain-containing protein n=1 Tax=Acinetobacter baumannii TaxID=470 RepID=UPI001177A364
MATTTPGSARKSLHVQATEKIRMVFDAAAELQAQQADANMQNNKGFPPLHVAIMSQHGDMIDELLNETTVPHVDSNVRTKDEKCALQLA